MSKRKESTPPPPPPPKAPRSQGLPSLRDFFQREPTAASSTRPQSTTSCVSTSVRPHAQSPPVAEATAVAASDTAASRKREPCVGGKPEIYTLSQWAEKRGAYPWIDCRNGNLGCSTCESVGSANLSLETNDQGRGKGLVLSKEWSSFEVTPSKGGDRKNQLTSLRNKIKTHADSKAHQVCVSIAHQRNKKTIETQIRELGVSANEATCRLMRTAYYVARNDRPYTDYEELVDLQQQNGLNLGSTLHSRMTCTRMIDVISKAMKRRIVEKIQEYHCKIGVLADEATTEGKKPVLIVYLRFSLGKGAPQTLSLELTELPDRGSETVANAILKSLLDAGFSRKYLEENWVCFTADGASVMLGKHSGVGARLRKLFSKIMLWHCLNHRLELAVADAIKGMTAINHFKIFMDKLYSHFSTSTKNQQELEETASELHAQLLRIGRVLNTRWSASSLRTVKAVWTAHKALFTYFDAGSTDSSRDATQRASMKGIADRLCSEQFLVDLGLMYDLLEELAALSLSLQNQDMTMAKADRACQRTIRVINTFRENPGNFEAVALAAVQKGSFEGTALQNRSRQRCLDRVSLIERLVASMEDRLCGSGLDPQPDDVPIAAWETVTLSDFDVLDTNQWPSDPSPRFGEDKVRRLCHRFALNGAEAVAAMREYVDDRDDLPAGLQPLHALIQTFSVSSADCERGFSAMNLVCTAIRNALTVAHISNLLFISVNGPPLSAFVAERYAKLWIQEHRTATDTRVRKQRDQKEEKKLFWEWL